MNRTETANVRHAWQEHRLIDDLDGEIAQVEDQRMQEKTRAAPQEGQPNLANSWLQVIAKAPPMLKPAALSKRHDP